MLTFARPAGAATLRLAAYGAVWEPQPARFTCTTALAITATHTIYAATDHTTNREVVIKQVRSDHTGAPGTNPATQLACEAGMLRFLARRGIPAPCPIAQIELAGQPSLAMSRIPGLSLEDLRRGRQINPAAVVRLAARLCPALLALHRAGFVHHDIKPANIMVRPDFTPVLIDWGSAEAIRPAHTPRPNSGWAPGFVSPDQARGLARPGNDLFALGMTLDALIDWPGPQLAQIIARATGGGPAYASAAALGRDLAQLALLDQLADYVGLRAV